MQCTIKIGEMLPGKKFDVYSGKEIPNDSVKEANGNGSTEASGLSQQKVVKLKPVPIEDWQADHFEGPKPSKWDQNEVTRMLDVAEKSMKDTVSSLNLRAKVLRKERAVGWFYFYFSTILFSLEFLKSF